MTYHILPIGDLEEHEELSTCKCKPEIQFEEGNMLVIHNSFDGREFIEEIVSEGMKNKN